MNFQAQSQRTRIAILLLLCIYASAFFFRALDRTPGWGLFLLGGFYCWMPFVAILGIPFSLLAEQSLAPVRQWLQMMFMLAWWANPCLWVGLILIRKRRWDHAVIAGTVAIILALFIFTTKETEIPGPGYWLWLASMVGLLVVAVAGKVREENMVRSLIADEAIEYERAPIGISDERICRMEPIDAIRRPSGPRL